MGRIKAILLLEAALILGLELVKVMEKHRLEDGAFGMPGTINPCHSGEEYLQNRLEELVGSFAPEKC